MAFTATASGRYFKVTRDGVYVSQHLTEREALERAATEAEANPTALVKYVHEYEVVVSSLTRTIGYTFAGAGGGAGVGGAAAVGSGVTVSGGFTPASGYTASGTFTDGQSVTIGRPAGGFGSKPNGAKPWLYIPMTVALGMGPDTAYSRGTSANQYGVLPRALSTTEFPPGSSSSFQSLQANGGNETPGYSFNPTTTALYLFAHRKFGYDTLHDAIGSNHKYVRAWNNDVGGTNVDMYSSYSGNGQTTWNFATIVENVSGNTSEYGVSQPGWNTTVLDTITTQWHTLEVEFQQSSAANVGDGVGIIWHLGSKTFEKTNYITANTEPTRNWRYLFLSQISNNAEPAGGYFYYGPLLIEDSRCRLIVSDEATWVSDRNTTAVRDFQLPTAWSDTSITLTIRKGIHASLSGKYLYVVNSSGVAQQVGRFN